MFWRVRKFSFLLLIRFFNQVQQLIFCQEQKETRSPALLANFLSCPKDFVSILIGLFFIFFQMKNNSGSENEKFSGNLETKSLGRISLETVSFSKNIF